MSRHKPTPPVAALLAVDPLAATGEQPRIGADVTLPAAPHVDAAEVERLTAENAALLAENARLFRALDALTEPSAMARTATIAATITALCDLARTVDSTTATDRARRKRWLDRAMAAGDALSAD